jgi:23S rRNA G2069 N7-methylase RlmK/C1962 C5-methylase RlmI
MFEVDPFKAEQQEEEQGEKREATWNRRLRSLEEWVCELLIKNQELRMSLRKDTANNNLRRRNSEEPSITTEGDDYDSPL